ncbi:helix-hairpin-helix domain-containing protein [Actinoplanes sp. NPDC026670]|uniref:helix-hairpin-helix domain-containing protein n=1 Tax=Actinoplanes sp. NPDC026670 TaxID=3154700 RepID=UPI0033C4EFDE
MANSAWLLTPILSFGCASVAGYLYVGLRARRPGWWIAGIGYSVGANVFLFIGESQPTESAASTVLAFLWIFTWMASVVHAVVINISWLDWLAGQRRPPTQPWTYQSAPQVEPAPAVPLLLDVNAANLDELASLPAIGPERAARAVAAREDRNGFATVAEFAAAAGLAPHQFAAVRDRLTCRPPEPAPQPQQDLPYGRIVDI